MFEIATLLALSVNSVVVLYTRNMFVDWVKENIRDLDGNDIAPGLVRTHFGNGDYKITQFLFDQTKGEFVKTDTIQANLIEKELEEIFRESDVFWGNLFSILTGYMVSDSKTLIKIQPLPASVSKEPSPQHLKVFLCHAKYDKEIVKALYSRLCNEGIAPWFDEKNLLPGQDWELEISNAVRNSDVVLVCLSNELVKKKGYVHKEISLALDVADIQPEGTVYIIPVKLDACNVPSRLSKWQWVNLYESGGFEKLLMSLRARAENLN